MQPENIDMAPDSPVAQAGGALIVELLRNSFPHGATINFANIVIDGLHLGPWSISVVPAQVGRNAKRQDPQGLGPKDEHAVGGTPMRPDTAGTWSNEERDGDE